MCQSQTQSPRGISGQSLKEPELTLNKGDFITPIVYTGAMPHGIGVWCTTFRITQKLSHLGNFRFGEKFKGPNIPFGTRTGPKRKPKKDLRLDPTSNPGIFLGYALQPGFIWRNAYLVAPLKDLNEKDFNESVQVIRVNQLTVPDGPFIHPLKGRYKAIREGLYESLSLEPPPDIKKMDAETVEDLVSSKKTALKAPYDGEDELEELLREAGLESDDIEVINPVTGGTEYIKR